MLKKRFPLTFIHKLLAGLFLLLAVLLFCRPGIYEKNISEDLENAVFLFLQEGDYTLEIAYKDSPEGNEVMVGTDCLTDMENRLGIEFARQQLPAGSGTVEIPIHLKERTEEIWVDTVLEDTPVLYEITLRSDGVTDRDNLFLGGIFLILAAGVLALGAYVPLEKYRIPLLLVGAAALSSIPLMNDFLQHGHDTAFHLARIEGIYEGMRTGQFPVYVNPVQLNGYGNLTGIMYPQFFLYVPALLRFAGVSTMLAYKLVIIFAHLVTAQLMYAAVRSITKSKTIGVTAGVLYTFALYRLVDAYTRGSIGELLAMAFLPLVIWGCYEVLWGDYKKWDILMLGMAAILQAHVLSVEMCAFFLALELLYWVLSRKKDRILQRLLAGAGAAAGTLLLCASFLVPFLIYSREPFQAFSVETVLSGTGAYFSQMFTTFSYATGQNMARGVTQWEMPLTIGGILPAASILFVITRAGKKEGNLADRLAEHCLALGIGALFLSSWLFPWDMVQGNALLDFLSSPLQYVWRFLGPASALLSVTGAVGIVNFAQVNGQRWIYALLAAVLLCSTFFYFDQVSAQMEDWGDKMEVSGKDDTDSLYLYGETGFNYYQRQDANIKCTNGSSVEYFNYEKKGMSLSVNVETRAYQEDAWLVFPIYYYPGYMITVDGQPVESRRIDTKLACALPEGSGHIRIEFVGRRLYRAADAVSILTAGGLIVWGIVVQRRKKAAFAKKQGNNLISQ